jgi:general secretion pathway protein A
LSRALALQGLAAVSEQDNLYVAVNAVLCAWRVPVVSPVAGEGATLRSLARQRGMTATRISGGLDALVRLDAPALLHVALPNAGARLVALISLDREGVSVVPAIEGRSRLSRAELALIWSGDATLLWKDFYALTSRKKTQEKVQGERLLQGLLKEVGCYFGTINGNLSHKTAAAVSEFQRREGLPVDGRATGPTLLLLYRRAGGFFPPGLSRERSSDKGASHPGGNG